MRIRATPACDLTYCLNIHPGEAWDQAFENIRRHVPALRDVLCPGAAFGLGLRLGNEAVRTLGEPAALESFRRYLAEARLYVVTINGFPYGPFHGQGVKTSAYCPDWRTPDRLDYTVRLAEVLAALIPEGGFGSISTVPGSYGPWIRMPDDAVAMARQLVQCAGILRAIEARTGRRIGLALEPEPDCYLDTVADAIAFFERQVLPQARCAGVGEELVRRHLGVCFDLCHEAVAFGEAAAGVAALERAGIGIFKTQISAALETTVGVESLRELARFEDVVYLHPVRVRADSGAIRRFGDLTAGTLEVVSGLAGATLRTHFHVPLYWGGSGRLRSTASGITASLMEQLVAAGCRHYEIETYTFGVLPPEVREAGVMESLRREFEFARARF
jgi:hypothetical protein